MNRKLFIKLYEKRGIDNETTEQAINVILELEKYLESKSLTFENTKIKDIKTYIALTLEKHEIDLDSFLAMARYFYVIKNNDVYIYFTKVLGGIGVIDNIKARIIKYAGQETLDIVFKDLKEPPLGTPMEEIPRFTRELMKRIEITTEPAIYKKFLAGNNHGIPKEAMAKEKLIYEESESLDEYLIGRHLRNVAELQAHCNSNTVWYEQKISQQVVDFVKSNQEILSAVKKDNKLYITKIPFDADNYLNENDPIKKRYYACHCSFARESILSRDKEISANWCYCSAGFAKFPFEVILERELDIKILKSPLKGDMICRFEIDLGEN